MTTKPKRSGVRITAVYRPKVNCEGPIEDDEGQQIIRLAEAIGRHMARQHMALTPIAANDNFDAGQ